MNQICVHLDRESTTSVRKYRYIAERKFEDLKMLPEERNKIINDLCDNGNNGMKFLRALETREGDDLTCSRFSITAKNLKRKDIKNFLEKLKIQSLFDLDLDDKTTLASMLSKQDTVIKGWRNFADEFGFSREDKDAIENGSKNDHSPSRTLLTKNDTFSVMPLSELKVLSEKCTFEEVSKIIGEIISQQ